MYAGGLLQVQVDTELAAGTGSSARPPTNMPFDAIVEQSVAGIYVLQDERFVYANATMGAIVGKTPAELVGVRLADCVPADFLPELLRLYYMRIKGEPPSMHFISRIYHSDGHIVYIEVHGTRIVFQDRPAVMGIAVDVTQRLCNEQELQRSREQLQQLSAYTMRKLEQQGTDIARELHDQLGGLLTSIKMEAVRVLRRAESTEQAAITSELIALAQHSIDAVREIAWALRPAELDTSQLAATIDRTLAEFSARSGVAHAFDRGEPTDRLTPKRATALFRVLQEALTNVARHACASRVEVALRTLGDRVVLELVDDGIGFDVDADTGAHLGLLSMHERAREIGAELKLRSAPGTGTRLSVTAPLL